MIGTLVILGIVIPSKIHGDESEAVKEQITPLTSLSDTSDKEQIIEAIRYTAKKYLIDDRPLIQTLQCESSFDNTAMGKAGEIGIAQFMPATWELWNKERGTNLEIHRIQNQIDMAAYAFSKGYQRHWTCWRIFFSS